MGGYRIKKGCSRPRMLNEKRCSIWNSVLVVVCALLFALLLLDLVFVRQYMVVQVSGRSMEVTLYDGDVLYADRFAVPERGDIVIINVSPYRETMGFQGDFIIKRLIALEGDSVLCEEHTVYVRRAGTEDFIPLDEPYTGGFLTGDFREVKVGEGEIFFLGDHRTNSTDSRAAGVGCLKYTDIAGVVPEWSVKAKSFVGIWERFRNLFGMRAETQGFMSPSGADTKI